MNKSAVSVLLGSVFLLCATTVCAQSSAGAGNDESSARGALEEVTVTARRRAESLLDVPVVVSAISNQQLENNLSSDLLKVAELAPQVMVGRATNGTGGFLTVRGISSSASDAGLEQSVSLNFDGVPLARGRIVTAHVFDMKQVEVMQGPQALYFGKNSPAGVISLRTADPEDYFETYVRAGYEFEADERYVEGAVSGPFSDTFRARLALRVSSMDGWITNVGPSYPNPLDPSVILPGATNGRTGPDGDNFSGRVTLLWEPSDSFEANLKVTYDAQEWNAMNALVEIYCINGVTEPTQIGLPMPGADCEKNQVKSESSLPVEYAQNFPYGNNGVPYFDSDFTLAALNLDWRFDKYSLTSTTGYYEQSIEGGNNADYSPNVLVYDTQNESYDLFTQELRLVSDFDGSLNYVAGVYYEHSSRDWGNYPDIFHFYNEASDNYALVETISHETTSSYSAFAQLLWDLAPNLQLAAGGRWTHDEKDGDYVNLSFAAPLYPWRPVGDPLIASYSDDNFSPELTLSWHPGDGQMIYGGYKTGYKAGAISNGALLFSTFTPESVLVDPEKAKGFEIGYRGELLGNTLRLDVTAYDYDYEDLQVSSFDEETFSFRVGNAADSYTRGVTASLQWVASENLTFNGNLGYNRARYSSYPNSPCYTAQTEAEGCVDGVQDLSGQALVRAPDLMYSLGADYHLPFSSGWTADLSASAAYTDDYQAATDNNPGGRQESFWRFNAAVHVLTPSEKIRLSLIGRNLTDEYYMIYSVSHPTGTPDQFAGIFNRPREIVLQAEYRY